MNKTALLTDSACDIPIVDAQRLDIHVMNIDITVDGKPYVERVDFTPEEYLSILDSCKEIPTTSQITVVRMVEQYQELAAKGYTSVIHVTIAGTGSGIYNNAIASKAYYERKFAAEAPLDIHVVDSRCFSVGYGYPLCCAADMLARGAQVEEVVAYLEDDFSRTEILLGMYSLKFAKKSGRISTVAAFAGEMMGLKPVVLMKDGSTQTIGRVRGEAALLPAMVAECKKRLPAGAPYCVAYTVPGRLPDALALFKKEIGYPPAMVIPLGAAVATNAGPDSFGVRFTVAK